MLRDSLSTRSKLTALARSQDRLTVRLAVNSHRQYHIVVFGGGIIPDDDIAALKKQGVEKLFTPGTPLQDIVDWLRKRFPEEKR